jgi:hypothetical protein
MRTRASRVRLVDSRSVQRSCAAKTEFEKGLKPSPDDEASGDGPPER